MSFDKIIFALDFSNSVTSHPFNEVIGKVGLVKVGMEMFYGDFHSSEFYKDKMFLDLKLHDIPETVGKAVKNLCKKYKPKFLSVHLSQPETIKRAVEEAAPYGTKIIGITVLTSLTESQCIDYHGNFPRETVEYLACNIDNYGSEFGGFVCSGQEASLIRYFCPEATIIVPGVRSKGTNKNDQRRVVTPAEAIKAGADYVVIGRQIRDAENPIEETTKIASEIQEAKIV